MTHYLEIAGTSAGGSSYMNRVINLLQKAPEGTDFIITIGKGEKQVEVYKMVSNQLLQLHRFVAGYGGSIKESIVLIMEP